MKVLFYLASHFNADMIGPQLERIQYHLDLGHSVTILACHKELESCNVNHYGSSLTCAICKSNLNAGLSSLKGDFKLLSFNAVLPKESTNLHHELINIDSLDIFKEITYESFDIGMACTSSLNSILRDPKPNLLSHRPLVMAIWNSAIWTYQLMVKAITENSYDAVYVFNGRVATLRSCLRACQNKGVDCYILEAGYRPHVYAVYKNALPHNIQYVEGIIEDIWENYGENRVKDAEYYFHVRSKGKDLLNEKYSTHQVEGILPANWDAGKRNVSIFVSSEDEFVSIGNEWANPLFGSQIEGIKTILDEFRGDNSFHFYIRIHPNLYGVYNESTILMHQLDSENATVILARDRVNTYSLIQASEKTITFGSSVGIEATALNKPSILVAKCFYSNLGSTYNPGTVEELFSLIRRNNLEALDRTGALKYGLFLASFGVKYDHYSIENHFKGKMNGKIVRPMILFYWLRLIGRNIRLRKLKKQHAVNQEKLDKLKFGA
jgi:hypothetical protein